MIGYKLVDQDYYTRRGLAGETLWEVGKTIAPTGAGTDACGPGVLHDYAHPLLAVLLNPVHAAIVNPRLLVIEHDEAPQTDGLKRWTTGAVLVLREEPLPAVTVTQRVRWAILVALDSIGNRCPVWSAWADRWLSGEDRSREAAAAAAAVRAAGDAAVDAEWAASISSRAAADAAGDAAAAAAAAARVPAWAAEVAAWSAPDPHAFTDRLIELAEQAIAEEPG